MYKWQLFAALTGDGWLTVNGQRGIVQSIAREDGSGKKFNVQLLVSGKCVTIFVKTLD